MPQSKSELKRLTVQTQDGPKRVRALCWIEIEDDDPGKHPNSQFQLKLDAFRESVRPANEYGISIWRQDPMEYEVLPPRPDIRRVGNARTPTPKLPGQP